jgi:hypothetical protein
VFEACVLLEGRKGVNCEVATTHGQVELPFPSAGGARAHGMDVVFYTPLCSSSTANGRQDLSSIKDKLKDSS